MDWPAQATFDPSYASGCNGTPMVQSVALQDLELGRFRSMESYDAFIPDDTQRLDRVDTSLQGSGTGEPINGASDMECESVSSEDSDYELGLETPMQYAQFHGLLENYETDQPLKSELIPYQSEDIFQELRDPSNLLGMETIQKELDESLNERLDIDRETAEFLLSILAAKRQTAGDLDVQPLLNSELKPLKLELPVLAGDHDLEMSALRHRNIVKPRALGINPFDLDAEKDESISFPQAAIADKLRLEQELRNEKLDVTKEIVEFLQDVRSLSVAEHVDYASEAYNAYKNKRSLHLSPPLLPVTPPYSPNPPVLEALQVEMTSTPEDLIAKDAINAMQELLQKDREAEEVETIVPSISAQEVAAAIDHYTKVPSSSSPRARKRPRDLHVEPPLTPQHRGDSSPGDGSTVNAAKRVKFDPKLLQISSSPDMDTADQLLEHDHCQGEVDFQEAIVTAAEMVKYQVQNEELAEFDTTLRVQVPQLEKIRPQCCEITDGSHTKLTTVTDLSGPASGSSCTELLGDLRKWSGVSKLEHSLPWAPFPTYLAKVKLVEEFDNGSLERYLAEMKIRQDVEEVDLESFILSNAGQYPKSFSDSNDEEIEPIILEDDEELTQLTNAEPNFQDKQKHSNAIPESAMTNLLQKRQAEFAVHHEFQHQEGAADALRVIKKPLLQSPSRTDLMQSHGLAQFMQLQGRTSVLSPPSHQIVKGPNTSAPHVAAQILAPAAVMVPQTADMESCAKTPVSIPVPDIRHDQQGTIPVVVSPAFMSNRQLVRRLQTTLPGIDFVERDATILGQIQQVSGKQGDAEIVISPSTGVLMTTLQKLKQKPLPGQTSFFGIRDRIAAASTRYERLFVLVSDGITASNEGGAIARPLDELDCDALADLPGWTHLLDPDVQITHVAGGEQELANWLAATVSHCGVSDGRIQLLQDETMWERWLREAGLNAFAAQAVMARLKSPESATQHQDYSSMSASFHAHFGLSAFVAMGPKARIEQFGSLLGGEKVLRRVSEVIDGPWVDRAGKGQK